MKTNDLSLNQVTISVKDINESFRFYERLGLIPIVRNSHYARFLAPGNEATFSIHYADKVKSSTVVYFETGNVDEKVESLLKLGFDFVQLPINQNWQWREAYLDDPDGNRICIYQAGSVRIKPDWRLEESKKSNMLSGESFNEWLEKYKTACEHGTQDIIEAIFSNDAKYYKTPFEAPFTGINKILEFWKDAFESQTNITYDFEIIHTFNNKGIAKMNASFKLKNSEIKVWLDGIIEACFNAELKCTQFYTWSHRDELA